MLWEKNGTHQPGSLYAMLQPSQQNWAGPMEVMLSITWSCLCGKTQAFCSTYAVTTEGGVWEAAQADLTALCRQLGLAEGLVLLPVSSSNSVMTWEASWTRPL
jgi:hypothetical protein